MSSFHHHRRVAHNRQHRLPLYLLIRAILARNIASQEMPVFEATRLSTRKSCLRLDLSPSLLDSRNRLPEAQPVALQASCASHLERETRSTHTSGMSCDFQTAFARRGFCCKTTKYSLLLQVRYPIAMRPMIPGYEVYRTSRLSPRYAIRRIQCKAGTYRSNGASVRLGIRARSTPWTKSPIAFSSICGREHRALLLLRPSLPYDILSSNPRYCGSRNATGNLSDGRRPRNSSPSISNSALSMNLAASSNSSITTSRAVENTDPTKGSCCSSAGAAIKRFPFLGEAPGIALGLVRKPLDWCKRLHNRVSYILRTD